MKGNHIMATINMNPSGIAWEKQDVVLVTKSNVAHTCKGEKISLWGGWNREGLKSRLKSALTDNFVVVSQCFASVGYYVTIVKKEDTKESYISVVTKKFLGADRVEAFRKTYGLEPMSDEVKKYWYYVPHLIDVHQPGRYNAGCNFTIESELRVYRDKNVASVFKITYADGHSRYFTFKSSHFAAVYPWTVIQSKDVSDEASWFGNKEKYPDVIELFCEEDVHRNSFRNTVKISAIEKAIGGKCFGGDLKYDQQEQCCDYHRYNFDAKTRDEINSFMGIFSEEEEACREIFDKRYQIVDHCWRDPASGITNLLFLDKWTSCRTKVAIAEKKKTDDMTTLWSSIKWGPTGGSIHRSISWERRADENGDLIIAAYHDTKAWSRVAFVYNVKKRTRKLILGDERGGNPRLVVPSLKNGILGYFRLAPGTAYDYERGERVLIDEGPEQTIVGSISIKDLFAGTNVAWILNNEKEFGDSMFYLFKDQQNYWYENKIHMVQDDIKEGGRIGAVALCILATTGNAMMEQLLKSRMFRMYFLALASEAKQSNIFWDTSKKTLSRYDSCPFPYTSKGKNLKEMFGMSLSQLRAADKAIEIVQSETSKGDVRFSYRFPGFGCVAKVLGVDRLSAVDDTLFAEIVEMTKSQSAPRWNGWGQTEIFKRILMSNDGRLLKYLENNTPSGKIRILKNFKSSDELNILNDYLRMREDMIKLQEEKPEEDIFDDKTYPYKIGKAVKFIRFMPGMKVETGYYGGDYIKDGIINYPQQFVNMIKKKYAAYATEKGSVQLELNEYGAILGAIIKMNPVQHMNFLHDEMSQWYATYKDDSKIGQFKEATKRVRKYVWSDEDDTGLCIIAPKDPSDLRKEGSILHHCVASYMNPIIAGSHNIMFIRRVDMIDEPYYTLDISGDGEVTEVHGYSNCNMEDSDVDAAYAETGRDVYGKHFDIKKFLHNWAKAMHGKVKEKSLRSSYGKLDIIA